MSTFASNHVQLLSSSVSGNILKRDDERATAFSAPDERTVSTSDESEEIKTLYNLLSDLKSPLNYSSLRPTLATLTRLEDERRTAIISASAESEETTNLKDVLAAKILIGLYAQALDTTLKEACEADAEAEWWADIERSNRAVVWYLVASEYITRTRTSFARIHAYVVCS
jgi:nuclear-control-of-ATPase protein 2